MSDSKQTHARSNKWFWTLLVLVVLLGAYGSYRIVLRIRVNARLDEIRAAGEPVTWAELDAWYALPPGVENAADVMGRAFEKYAQWDDEKTEALPVVGKAELPPLTESLDDDTKTLIVEYLADNAEALKLLHAVAQIEYSRYPVDFTQYFEAPMPHLGQLRNGARLLMLEAIIHADANESDAAVKSVADILGVVRTMRHEPMLISQLVAIACRSLATHAGEQVMNRTALSDAQLQRLQRMFFDAPDPCGMAVAFIGERCLGAEMCRRSLSEMKDFFMQCSGSALSGIMGISLARYRLSGMEDLDVAVYLDGITGCVNACHLPPGQRSAVVKRIVAEIMPSSKTHLLFYFMPAINRAVTLDLMHIAELSTARTAIAVQRYGQANGHYPVTLDELIPDYLDAVPVDPFDGQALRYKTIDAGFVVYSVGEDGQDQGGAKRDKSKKYTEDNYDIAFWMERGLVQNSTTN